MERSIATHSIACAKHFATLLRVLEETADPPLQFEAAHDQYERFKIWAGNLGAFQQLPLKTSLDYRLRNSQRIADRIAALLLDLRDALQDASGIASGHHQNRISANGINEAEELLELTKSTVSILFRIAVLIRKASPRDRFARAIAATETFDKSFDIRHVHEKFPSIGLKGNDWLVERMGNVITQRRQYLSYARSHRDKLEEESPAPSQAQNSQAQDLLEVSLSHDISTAEESKSRAPTTASTLESTLVPLQLDFEDSQSVASSTLSLPESDDESLLRPPPLSTISKGESIFECPFCCSIQSIRRETLWRRHVYADLRSYVCTFASCHTKLFEDQRDWFEHELEQHRSQWRCLVCGAKDMKTEDTFRNHFLTHASNVTEDQMTAMSNASRQPPDQFLATDCPFCSTWESRLRDGYSGQSAVSVTPTQFMKHVGSHMRQLALFALPREYVEEDRDDEASDEEVNEEPERSARFIFQINEIDGDPDGKSIARRDGVSGMLWLCSSEGISPLSGSLPEHAAVFGSCSMYYQGGRGFITARGDATNGCESWKPPRFEHNENDSSSVLAHGGKYAALHCQHPGQMWPRMLLPDIYHTQPQVKVSQASCGLSGDLPLLLALIAFSMSRENLTQYLSRMYPGGAWLVHSLPHGRSDKRGVVVHVYTHPLGWSAEELRQYERGEFGHHYN